MEKKEQREEAFARTAVESYFCCQSEELVPGQGKA